MTCCAPTILGGASAIADVEYTSTMRAKYGAIPRVQLYYLEDGEYKIAGVYVNVQFNGTRILVDHGGPAQWLIKIS